MITNNKGLRMNYQGGYNTLIPPLGVIGWETKWLAMAHLLLRLAELPPYSALHIQHVLAMYSNKNLTTTKREG